MVINIEFEVETGYTFDSVELFKKITKKTSELLNLPPSINSLSVSVIITDDENIKELNKEFRDIDAPTDVLSFPMFDFKTPGFIDESELNNGIENLLGDIVISKNKVDWQAKEFGHSTKREMAFLLTHGLLHLLGYDHIEDDMRLEMEEKQRCILAALDITR